MEASVGTVPIANTMEIDVVSKYLNAQLGELYTHDLDEFNKFPANTLPLLNDEANFVFAKELGHISGQ